MGNMEDYISLHDRKERLYISEPEKVFIFPEGVFIDFSTLAGAKGIGNNRIKNISIFNVFNSYNNIRCEGN